MEIIKAYKKLVTNCEKEFKRLTNHTITFENGTFWLEKGPLEREFLSLQDVIYFVTVSVDYADIVNWKRYCHKVYESGIRRPVPTLQQFCEGDIVSETLLDNIIALQEE